MKKQYLLLIPCSLIGVIFYLLQNNLLLIHWISKPDTQTLLALQKNSSSRKKVTIFAWKKNTFTGTPTEVLWTQENDQHNLHNLVGAWLSCLQEENIVSRYVKLESIAYSPLSKEGIISFSQSPLEPGWSIFEKWHCIESLSKTIRNTNLPIVSLIFLINNQTMEDDHLDFSSPWPIDGFISYSP